MAEPDDFTSSPAPFQGSAALELRPRGDFLQWLAASRGVLGVSTYNSGHLSFFSAPEGEMIATSWRLERPMGVAFDSGRLAVAAQRHIWVFRTDERAKRNTSSVFELEEQYYTGKLDAHDLAWTSRGLLFVNTRFNCLARPSRQVRFVRCWQPWFVAGLQSRDACHLNGIGLMSGRPSMATAFGMAGEPGAWRQADRFSSGVVLDVRKRQVAITGLCMPHSPRRFAAEWWLCNSGEGTLCRFDPAAGTITPIVTLPGFTRGLCFAAGRAVVGLSRIRKEHILDAPPVRARFPRLRAGVALVNIHTGRETGRLEFVRGGREVYEIVFLPESRGVELSAVKTVEGLPPRS